MNGRWVQSWWGHRGKLGAGLFHYNSHHFRKKKKETNVYIWWGERGRENVSIINQMWWNAHVWRVWVKVSNSPFDPGPDPWAPMTWSPTAILATFLQVWTHIKIKTQVRSSFPLQPVAHVEVARSHEIWPSLDELGAKGTLKRADASISTCELLGRDDNDNIIAIIFLESI